MTHEQKREYKEFRERLWSLLNDTSELRRQYEEFKEDFDAYVDAHQDWMDEHESESWIDSPSGQRATEEHDSLETIQGVIEDAITSLENIETDMDEQCNTDLS